MGCLGVPANQTLREGTSARRWSACYACRRSRFNSRAPQVWKYQQRTRNTPFVESRCRPGIGLLRYKVVLILLAQGYSAFFYVQKVPASRMGTYSSCMPVLVLNQLPIWGEEIWLWQGGGGWVRDSWKGNCKNSGQTARLLERGKRQKAPLLDLGWGRICNAN